MGCIGVEADVWAYGDELYVAHDRGTMTPNQTLSAVYLDPLLEMLEGKNFTSDTALSSRGLYDLDPSQTVVMLVDIKSDVDVTWRLLLDKLKPLRERGLLSHFNDQGLIIGAITVVGTGNTLLGSVMKYNPHRNVFLDAPLADLDGGTFDASNSYYASVSFRHSIGRVGSAGLSPSQLHKLRAQIKEAHRRGLKVRYWGMPWWPMHRRNQVWDILLDEGVDVLNVDDLDGAREAYFKWYAPEDQK
ncbi:hypothetical protein G7046_g1563 [Stylonectria norvegica]|nr:hypothetical protein G7046_g1563 [Stylonectria norvegica]